VSPADLDIASGHRLAEDLSGVAGQRRCDARDRQRGIDAADALVVPPGQLGHGLMAVLRRQPARPVRGGTAGGHTGLFELICGDCGDHLYLDYSEVPARLQRLRGPRTMRAALAAYDRHLGLAT
jgi:hypothetical protein